MAFGNPGEIKEVRVPTQMTRREERKAHAVLPKRFITHKDMHINGMGGKSEKRNPTIQL